MRKIVLAACLAVLASAAQAAWLDVTPHAGYTTFSMGELNRANAALHGYDMQGHQQDLNNGFVAGLDLMTQRWTGAQGLSLGLRTEYLQSNLAENRNPNSTYNFCYTDQATLANLLVGAAFDAPIAGSGLSIGLNAWIGGGHGVVNQNTTHNAVPTGDPIQSGSFSADILVGELGTRLTYPLGGRFKLAAEGNWRWADAGQVKSGGTPLYNNLTYWYSKTKAPVNADFSGASLQGSVSYSF
jgi:hypothetical protein